MKHLTKILTLSLLALLVLAGCKRDEPEVKNLIAYGFVYTDFCYYTTFNLNTFTLSKTEKSPLMVAAEYYAGDIYGYDGEVEFFKFTHGTGVYQKLGFSNEGTIYDMSYDYSSNTMYCIIQGVKLGKVNLNNGSVSIVGKLETEYAMLAFASSLSGQLYGITYGENGTLWSINKTTGKATKIGDTGIKAETCSMTFHHASGKLYWVNALAEDRIFFLYEVNPTTAKVTKIGRIGSDNDKLYSIVGLYFPYDKK